MEPLEGCDEIVQMEEELAPPPLVMHSVCDDGSSVGPRVFPRIGDLYQAKIPPFNTCYLNSRNENDITAEKDDDYEELFAEGLPLPVMQIPLSSTKISPVHHEMDCMNEPSLENTVCTKESTISMLKMEHGIEQDSFKLTDERCIQENNFDDIKHAVQDHIDSSMSDLKGELSRTKEDLDVVCTDSIDTVNCAVDALPSGRGRRRRRAKGGWKRLKKAKIELSKPTKHRSDPNDYFDSIYSRSFLLVPGSPSESWMGIEEDVFILGLYIFGKNFKAVQNFMETKKMEDILAYYYSKFYGTESYCRWAESRNIRSRKCFQGHRIFSGWRQQELSMRLLPHVPDHLRDKIPDVIKEFNEGNVSIEEFVKELKRLVGLNTLVQAIGIGKGSHDLTAALMDPMKASQIVSARCEIPTGRACSSLSTEEIVKFLTGDYRLSKARSNDLFWEAVWPRLLARGWHSEQPEDQGSLGSRQSLVFLLPGVHKFSRRLLVKGIHYFDSLSEVLSRVASEPRLLDPPNLDMSEMARGKVKPECIWTSEFLEEQSDHKQDRPCYLQPRYRRNDIESYVFTVVDTSLVSKGEKPACFRHSRMLPADDFSTYLECASGEAEDLNSEFLSAEVQVNQPSILDRSSTYPTEVAPVMTHIENSAEYDDTNTASPLDESTLPSSQSEQNSYCSVGLILQAGSSAPLSEPGTGCLSFSDRGRTWDLNKEEYSYPASGANSQEATDPASHVETPFPFNNLASISQQRRMSTSNCDENQTRDSRLIGFASSAKGQLVASSLVFKFDAKEESTVSVVETDMTDKGKCIIPSDQHGREKSYNEVSSLLCGSMSSLNRNNNMSLHSELLSPQDYTEKVNNNMLALGNEHMEDIKSEDNSVSKHDSGNTQDKPTNLEQWQGSSPVADDDGQKSGQKSQLEQDCGHYHKQPNGSREERLLRDNTGVEDANLGNSESWKFQVLCQKHPNGSAHAQSRTLTADDGQPTEVEENHVHEFRVEGRRQSTRNRPLTAKALEAYASGFYTARRRKGGKTAVNMNDSQTKPISRQFVHSSTSLVNSSSSDNNDITIVDTSMESVEGEGNNDSHFGRKSRSIYKRRRTHAVMKVPKTGLCTEILGQEKKEEMVNGILVSEVGN